jgi:hypothetical protein
VSDAVNAVVKYSGDFQDCSAIKSFSSRTSFHRVKMPHARIHFEGGVMKQVARV